MQLLESYGFSEEEILAEFNNVSAKNPDKEYLAKWLEVEKNLVTRREEKKIEEEKRPEGRIGKYIRKHFKEIKIGTRFIWTIIGSVVIFLIYGWFSYSYTIVSDHIPTYVSIYDFIETVFSINSLFWISFGATVIYWLIVIIAVIYHISIIILAIDIPRWLVYKESTFQNGNKWGEMPLAMIAFIDLFFISFIIWDGLSFELASVVLLLSQILIIPHGIVIRASLHGITGWIGDKEDINLLPILMSSDGQSDELIKCSLEFFQDDYYYKKKAKQWLWKESENFYRSVFLKKDKNRIKVYMTSTKKDYTSSRISKGLSEDTIETQIGSLLLWLHIKYRIYAKIMIDRDDVYYQNETLRKTKLEVTKPNPTNFIILLPYRLLKRRKKRKEDYESLMKTEYELPTDYVILDDVQSLLNRKIIESIVLDYKTKCPNDLSDLIVAFANTEGGHIVFGMDEKDTAPERIVGISSAEIEKITQSFDHISPTLELQHSFWYFRLPGSDDKRIAVLFIPKHPNKELHMSKGKVFKRVGSRKVPLHNKNEIESLKEKIEGR